MVQMIVLAGRNLVRNPIRTALTGMAIAFGLSLMLWTIYIQTGQHNDILDTGIANTAGHVVVQVEGFNTDQDTKLQVQDSGAKAEAIAKVLPEATVLRRALLPGLLSSANGNASAMLTAIDQAAEADFQQVDDRIVEGEWGKTGKKSLVIGAGMADALQVGIGDKVVYMGQHGTEEVESKLFRVGGIFKTGNANLDGFVAFADLDYSQSLMPGSDPAHQIAVQLQDLDGDADAAKAAVIGAIETDGLEILHWQEALPDLWQFIQMDKQSSDILLAFLGIVVAAGVFNTTLMSTSERTKEIGVLMAIGMRPGAVMRLVLLEAAVLGTLATVLGVLGGIALGYPAVTSGLDYSGFLGGADTYEAGGVVVSTLIKGAWNWEKTAVYASATVIFSVLSAIYPAWSATRMSPVDAMRHP